ncbi:MAG: protoheme IX farnesyltransferase [Candidatus Sulfobium sp.]|jgi:protoheme IX farnesyltransferase
MNMGGKNIAAYAGLCRMRISLFSACSAGAGFLLIRGPAWRLAGVMMAVFVLACGASALNQHSERATDARMPRTRSRPLPSGRIGSRRALLFAVMLLVAGCVLLAAEGNIYALSLGAFTVVWYNGVYTPLKKRTAFAVFPGGLVGAVPPAVGWTAAGGGLFDPGLLFLCFFFFMWQVPHFWLFLLNYGEEYERAGLPALTSIFAKEQIARISFVWISSVAVSCIFIGACGVTKSLPVGVSLVAVSVWLIWNGARLLHGKVKKSCCSFAFRGMNAGMVLVMIVLAADRLFQF